MGLVCYFCQGCEGGGMGKGGERGYGGWLRFLKNFIAFFLLILVGFGFN